MTQQAQSKIRPMDAKEWSMLLALSLLWGGSFFFNGVAVRELPSLTLVWLRVAIAAAALTATLRLFGQPLPRDAATWRVFAAMALINNVVPFSLIVWGQHRIPSGLAAILNAATPLFTVLLAHRLSDDERLNPRKLAGVAIGFAGTAVMIGPDLLATASADVAAQFDCLAAALSYALAGLYGRRFRRLGIPPLVTAAGQVCASSVLLAPFVLLIDRPWKLHAPAWAALIGLGLLSTALAYWLYFRILAAAGATNLLLVTFLVPIGAILLGATVLHEMLQARHLAGMALIGAGLAFIDGRLFRRRTRPAP